MITRFRDIADIRSGFPFRGRVENDPAGELAVVHMRDIQPGQPLEQGNLLHIKADNLPEILNTKAVPDLSRHLLEQGDVIFQSRGNNNRAVTCNDSIIGIVALGLYRIRPDKGQVTGAYLAWYLNDERTQRRIASMAQGTQIPFIAQADLAMLTVPVPSLAIQQKIVDMQRVRERQRQLQVELDTLTDQLLSEATWQLADSSS